MLDDLSSAQDVATERQIWDQILASPDTRPAPTMLFVSHRHEALRRADQIVVDRGRVVAAGRFDDVRNHLP